MFVSFTALPTVIGKGSHCTKAQNNAPMRRIINFMMPDTEAKSTLPEDSLIRNKQNFASEPPLYKRDVVRKFPNCNPGTVQTRFYRFCVNSKNEVKNGLIRVRLSISPIRTLFSYFIQFEYFSCNIHSRRGPGSNLRSSRCPLSLITGLVHSLQLLKRATHFIVTQQL